MILHLFRSNLRRRWMSTLVLVLLVGVALGITMGSAVGARRTATAFPRFAEQLSVPDLTVYVGMEAADAAEAIREQPQVARAGVGSGVGLMPRLPDGTPDFERALGAVVGDGVFGVAVDQPLILEGRLPADDAPLEIMLDEKAAKMAGVRVGDRFPASTFNVDVIIEKSEAFERSGREPTEADLAEVFTPVDLEIVGIGRTSNAVLVNEAVSEDAGALLSPAYGREFPDTASYTVAVVDLVHGASAGDYVTAVRRELPGIDVGPTDLSGQQTAFAAAVRPYWLALAFFAAVFGLGAVLALGPTVVRVVDEELTDRRTLRALGAGRRQLLGVAALRSTAIGVGGALTAVVVAIGLSSMFPIGPARAAEPDRGMEVHVAGLAAGVAVIVAAVLCASLLRASVLIRTAPTRTTRPSAVVSAAGAAGLSPTALTALHAAFAGGGDRGRRRLASSGVIGALAMAIAALGFGSGFTRLVDDPARFGWSWDVMFENYDSPLGPEIADGLLQDPAVLGFVPISRGSVTLDGKPVPAIGMDLDAAGGVRPAIIDGRAPVRPGEIALGAVTARDLGVGIGDRLDATTTDDDRRSLEVVGTAVIPSIQLDESNQLGEGAFLLADDYEQLAGWFPSAALAAVRDGTTLVELEERHFISALGVQRPGDIRSYDGVDGVPMVLAAILGALGVSVLVHVIVGSVRQRRRELAILRTIGLRPRQVAGTVLLQTTAQALAVLVVAVPLGVAAGRLSWRWFADGIGVESDPSTPLALIAAALVAVLVAIGLAAVAPARHAGSVHPADALRAE